MELAETYTTNKKQIRVIFSKWEFGPVPELQIIVIQLSKWNSIKALQIQVMNLKRYTSIFLKAIFIKLGLPSMKLLLEIQLLVLMIKSITNNYVIIKYTN